MPTPRSLPRHAATRYVQPLREGGSLPAVVDTAAGGLFVVKFRGAGQGPKALIAELVVGQLARGLRYLDGAFNFDATAAGELISADFATRLVWLDALATNPDRSHRNPNLLVWRRSPWLIDHGGALYAQHDWAAVDEARTRTPFARIRDHVLLDRAGDLGAIDAALAAALSPDVIGRALEQVPDELLVDPIGGREFASASAARARYREYLEVRLRAPRDFVAEAARAQGQARSAPARPLSARR
jgi:hypothetical protein